MKKLYEKIKENYQKFQLFDNHVSSTLNNGLDNLFLTISRGYSDDKDPHPSKINKNLLIESNSGNFFSNIPGIGVTGYSPYESHDSKKTTLVIDPKDFEPDYEIQKDPELNLVTFSKKKFYEKLSRSYLGFSPESIGFELDYKFIRCEIK